jgi:hypothetical protein
MSETQALSNDILADGFADLSITFGLSVKEHVRAHRSLLVRHPAGWILYGVFLGVPLAMIVYLLLLGPDPDPAIWLLAGAALAVSAMASYAIPFAQVLSLRKGQAGIAGPHTMTLTDGGVRMRSPHSDVDLSWEAIYRARETKEFIFIHMGKNVAYFLPKRVLTPEMLSRARELLLSRLGKRARLFEPDGR